MAEFICVRGDCDNFALMQPNSFVISDELGRNWICFESQDVVQELDNVQASLWEMQRRSHRLGLDSNGTDLSAVVGVDPEVLPEWLASTR